ncbi:MAG: Na+/H+ antiporter NhaC [Chitinophagales bacterium]|nr:Na+/H+ antiporter NhaC [Chitinophagales bacterium]
MNTEKELIPAFYKAMIPVVILVTLLSIDVIFIYKDSATDGSIQLILIFSAAIAAVIGINEGFSWEKIETGIVKSISTTTQAIIILLLIGALAGAWMLSGIVPAMIYYGLKLLNPAFFLFAACVICSLVSVSTGSSWSTVATVGIALFAVGKTLGYHEGLIAGAIISGAYFGDKVSPLSETTNMAAAVAETDLFTHVKYMLWTNIPNIFITLMIYLAIGWNFDVAVDMTDIEGLLVDLQSTFYISPILFVVPALVILLIVKKTPAIPALMIGTILGAVCAIVFQQNLMALLSEKGVNIYAEYYRIIVDAMTVGINIPTENTLLDGLLSSSGMSGMLSTVWLIIAAMMFGGTMEACNFLKSITIKILKWAKTDTSLITATVFSSISTNIIASDQYLSILIPGRMYVDAYKERGLAPENLSRSLEDGGTVTSVLVPWNTCGAYQSSVLGIPTLAFAPYCFYNIISPIMSITYSALKIKIKKTPKTSSI